MRHSSFLDAGVCPLVVAAAILWCGAERCLVQEPSKTGTSKEERIVVHGEVVEVTGDKVRVAVKDKQQPHIGDPVKINFEIRGTVIKANVASGMVTNVETGFASVDITDKTSEIRNGYLAEITSTGATVAKKPPSEAGAKEPPDLSGEWEETFRLGKSVWTLKRRADGRYGAQQQEFGKATGSGDYTDGVLKIEWETADGFAGIQEWRLNPTLDAGKGKGIGTKRYVGTDDVSVVRLSKPKPDTSVETKTKTDTGVQPNAVSDLSGVWEATLYLGKSIWTLKLRPDRRYDAQQQDFGKATGIGVFADGLLKIEWETANGYAGIEEWRINPALNAGKGKGIGVKRFTGEHDVTVVRLSTPGGLDEKTRTERFENSMELGKILLEKKDFAGAVKAYREALKYFPKNESALRMLRHAEESDKREEKVVPEKTGESGAPNDLSGRWREDTGAIAPVWTLIRQADGKYEVRQDVVGHPSTGCKGTAEFAKGTVTILWVQDKLKNKGGGDWRIDGTQTKANATHYVFSFTGRDDRNYSCTVTRLSAEDLGLKESPNDKEK